MTRTNLVLGFTLTGGVLAGGLGERLGKVDKGWVKVSDQPLIQRVLERLQPQVDTIIINANRNVADYARFGWLVVNDALPDFPGPLAGISAVLEAARTDWVLCVPVDAARLPNDLALRLCDAVRQNGSPAAFVNTKDGAIPVCSLVSRALREDLKTYLASGGRSVHLWLQSHGATPVSYSEWPSEFWSINTPVELTCCEQRLDISG